MSKSEVFFMEVSDLKTLLGVNTINVLIDKETQKKSFKINDVWFRVQATFDAKLPMAFMTSEVNPDGSANWLVGTLINVDDSNSKKELFVKI
jgi:hypothetical protein